MINLKNAVKTALEYILLAIYAIVMYGYANARCITRNCLAGCHYSLSEIACLWVYFILLFVIPYTVVVVLLHRIRQKREREVK